MEEAAVLVEVLVFLLFNFGCWFSFSFGLVNLSFYRQSF